MNYKHANVHKKSTNNCVSIAHLKTSYRIFSVQTILTASIKTLLQKMACPVSANILLVISLYMRIANTPSPLASIQQKQQKLISCHVQQATYKKRSMATSNQFLIKIYMHILFKKTQKLVHGTYAVCTALHYAEQW